MEWVCPPGVPLRCPRCFDGLGEGGETTPAQSVYSTCTGYTSQLPDADEALVAALTRQQIGDRYYLIPAKPEDVPGGGDTDGSQHDMGNEGR